MYARKTKISASFMKLKCISEYECLIFLSPNFKNEFLVFFFTFYFEMFENFVYLKNWI